jgi:cellulase
LHAAQSAGGAQFYFVHELLSGQHYCGGSCEPSWCAYEATDPGILIGVYKPITDYVIPGPAVFTG